MYYWIFLFLLSVTSPYDVPQGRSKQTVRGIVPSKGGIPQYAPAPQLPPITCRSVNGSLQCGHGDDFPTNPGAVLR